MKKPFLILTLATLSLPAWSTCQKKVDNSKVMMFVDTNFSDMEIAVAEKAACKRGERLLVIPKNYKSYTKIIKEVEASTKALERCRSNCDEVRKKSSDARTKLDNHIRTSPPLKEAIEKELSVLKEQNAKLKNFTISGHDGGGYFGGHKGGFGRQELAEMMKNYPEINEVQNLMLLGCYTGVQKEIIEWKGIFPKARLIAGYDGSAPLSDRPLGHYYLEDLLLKENELIKQADEKKINSYVDKNIRGLKQLNAAIYLDPYCEEDKTKEDVDFYFGSKVNKDFKPFNAMECINAQAELNLMAQKYELYYSGEKEPPKNSSSGELRDMYDRARSLEHCLSSNNTNFVSNLFNLRFYDAVKKNFANHYKDQLADAEKILDGLKPEDILKNLDKQNAEFEESLKKQEEEIKLLETDPEKYFALQKEDIERLEKEKEELLEDPAYREIYERFGLNSGTFNPFAQSSPEDSLKLAKILNLSSALSIKTEMLKWEKDNAAGAIAFKKGTLQSAREHMVVQKAQVEELLKKPESKVWVPNEKNLGQKSRKETLQNLHQMQKMMLLPGLSSEQRGTMSWMYSATAQHLQYFQNPFSWHEFTGRTEDPPNPMNMSSFMQSSQGGGFVGGYGGGFSGGYSGGSGISFGSGVSTGGVQLNSNTNNGYGW